MKAYQDRRTCFTPLCVSVDGMFGVETEFFLKRLGDYLAVKWECPFSVIMCWIRARLSFAILRATMLCICGSCTKWRSLGNYRQRISFFDCRLTLDFTYLVLCVVLCLYLFNLV